jgi:glycosyl hydrolase family 113
MLSGGEGGAEAGGGGGRLLLLLLAAILITCRGGAEPPPDPPAPPKLPVLAIHAPADLLQPLREGSFFRWGLPRLAGLRVEVGPDASGDAEVWLDRLPASPAVAARVQGLPVRVAEETVVLGGTRYAGQALALRLPAAEKPAWIVVGPPGDALLDLAGEVLFRVAASLTGNGRGRRRAPLDVDYVLRESPWMERSGRWLRSADGSWGIDPDKERDDLAAWERDFAGMAEIRSGRVVLRVAPDQKGRPELARLAAELDGATAEMAPRVPLAVSSPVLIVVEPDHVAQGRHTGEIGEAVPGPRADLHLVYDAADLPAYRFALARTLIARAGVAKGLPIALQRGAALWLSRDWYGRSYPDWLPLLAAARALPAAEDLLAEEEPPDASPLLWTPAAAALVERLPGATLAEKLAHPPSRSSVATFLGSLGESVGSVGSVRSVGSDHPPAPFLRGVSLAMHNSLEGGYHAPGVGRQLDQLKRLGADAVSLMPFAFQPGPDRPELRYLNRGPGSETDIGLIHAARLARAQGFHVLWKPHVWVSGASWPGEIEMKSEPDWQAWWRSYRRYVLHHALLARWAGADLFCVGVELSKAIGREADWRELIAGVRLLFPGQVTYAANWYGDLESVRFWDRLDYLGVDAYFPLAASPQASPMDLAKGAEQIAQRLAAASRRFGRPVLLTEVGFAAHRGAWVAPHTEGGEYSEDDQALAYQALFKALDHQRWLAGTFLWKAFSSPEPDGGREADFRFLGRKAEGVVREYFGRAAGR